MENAESNIRLVKEKNIGELLQILSRSRYKGIYDILFQFAIAKRFASNANIYFQKLHFWISD